MDKKEKKQQGCRKRIVSVIAVLVLTSFLILYNWTNEVVKIAHITPSTPRINIDNLIGKNELSNQELQLISEQTGINMATTEMLLEQEQDKKLLELQEAYYAPVSIATIRTTPLTICEYVIDENGEYTKGTSIVNLKDGDIVITKNSRFLGWRNGHAGPAAAAGGCHIGYDCFRGSPSAGCRGADPDPPGPAFPSGPVPGNVLQLPEHHRRDPPAGCPAHRRGHRPQPGGHRQNRGAGEAGGHPSGDRRSPGPGGPAEQYDCRTAQALYERRIPRGDYSQCTNRQGDVSDSGERHRDGRINQVNNVPEGTEHPIINKEEHTPWQSFSTKMASTLTRKVT